MNWKGVIPAITTNLRANGAVDHAALAKHCRWMIDSGCTGIVCCGSLGEAATLSSKEKLAVAATCVKAVGDRAPVVLGIAALSTAEAVALAKGAARAGCEGVMVLPPYVYSTDWREMKAHVSAVIAATKLSCLLYNNPVAYKTDFLPWQIAELAADHPNLHAVKESSGDTEHNRCESANGAHARARDGDFLLERKRRRFAERSAAHDAGAAAVDHPMALPRERRVVDRAVGAEVGRDGGKNTGPVHGIQEKRSGLSVSSATVGLRPATTSAMSTPVMGASVTPSIACPHAASRFA
jgi:hypothetical protein